jgi:exodeoxyribonuclease III
MKLISWNCQRGLRIQEKIDKISELSPDIAILAECPHPNKIQNDDHHQAVWVGKNEGIGLGVFSMNEEYKLSMVTDEITYEWIVPIKVSGKEEFVLIAVWTKRCPGYSSYGKLLYTALKEYERFLSNSRVIVIGDFNIDKKLPSSYSGIQRGKGFEQIIGQLKKFELESCYHYFSKEEYGSESEATYYHYRKRDRPFHIDYCFASKEILKETEQFYILESNDWSELSDHLPLVLETK